MKLALGISLISAFALVLLYSILVGVMVPGWKSSTGNLLNVLNGKAVAYVYEGPIWLPPNDTAAGWLMTTIQHVKQPHANWTIVVAIPSEDFYGNMEHTIVVASCAGLAVLAFLVLTLWLTIHFCVNRQLAAKKTGGGTTSDYYTLFDELK